MRKIKTEQPKFVVSEGWGNYTIFFIDNAGNRHAAHGKDFDILTQNDAENITAMLNEWYDAGVREGKRLAYNERGNT